MELDCKNKKNKLICKDTFPVSNYPSLIIYPHGHGHDKKSSKMVFSKHADKGDLNHEIDNMFPSMISISGQPHYG